VTDDDEIMIMTARGKIQRIEVNDINVIGRNTQGVRIMSIDDDDALVAVVRVPKEEGNGDAEEGDVSMETGSQQDAPVKENLDVPPTESEGQGD
jgi:DNA gyrase subunit A